MQINDVQFGSSLLDIISELQRQLSINNIQLLGHIRDTPDNVMISCPYHKNGQESRPSAGISKKTGVFHCFACGEVHSLQEMISYCFGHYDDVLGGFGWNWLLKNFLTISVEERKDVDLDFSRDNMCVTKLTSKVTEDELDSYRYYHPYMWERKMTPEIVDMFDIGYDASTECITFPVRNIKGNTLFVARRSVNTKYFNYPAGAEKPIYGLYELAKYGEEVISRNGTLFRVPKYTEIIVCESMIDAITCWVYGKYAVALNGLGNDLQFEQLRDFPCRKLILATDMDDAGIRARNRIRKNVSNKIITEYVWDKSVAKDINDMTREYFNNLEEIM